MAGFRTVRLTPDSVEAIKHSALQISIAAERRVDGAEKRELVKVGDSWIVAGAVHELTVALEIHVEKLVVKAGGGSAEDRAEAAKDPYSHLLPLDVLKELALSHDPLIVSAVTANGAALERLPTEILVGFLERQLGSDTLLHLAASENVIGRIPERVLFDLLEQTGEKGQEEVRTALLSNREFYSRLNGTSAGEEAIARVMPKQVILVLNRVDGNELKNGKATAQATHAATGALRVALNANQDLVDRWEENGSKQVVLKGDSVERLQELYFSLLEAGIPCYLQIDAGKTHIPSGSVTALGIGPWGSQEIDVFTRKTELPLLR